MIHLQLVTPGSAFGKITSGRLHHAIVCVGMALANRTSHPLEARVFLQCYEEFKTSVQDARSLADELHSRGLVEEAKLRNVDSRNLARSTQRLTKQLFLATHQELCTDPMKFAAMLEALKSDDTLKSLCKQMELVAGETLCVLHQLHCFLYVTVPLGRTVVTDCSSM